MLDHWQEELQELIDRQCADVLTDAEATRLEELVCGNEDACRFYCEYTSLVGMLFLEHEEDESPECLLTANVMPRVNESDEQQPNSIVLGFLGDIFRSGTNAMGRPFVLTLLFTLGIPGIVLILLLMQIGSEQGRGVAVRPEITSHHVASMVARVTRIHQCVWDKPAEGVLKGDSLTTGQRLQLRQGLLELHFIDGASVIIEGPATFKVQSNQQGSLQVGNLIAKVPKGAEGFTIVTPSAKIVDFGTEFGVQVSGDGTTETHVFQGEVEVATRPEEKKVLPSKKRLHAGQAVQVKTAVPGKEPQIVTMASAEEKFVRQFYEDLPQPTIIFAHRGSADPTSEGWLLRHHKDFPIKKGCLELGPVDEDGVPAWSIRTCKENQVAHYSIDKDKGLTPKLLAEANEKGWVLRVRVWMSEKNPMPPEKWKGIATFSYRDGNHVWTVRPSVEADGNQCFFFLEHDPLGTPKSYPVPQSRNQYVDYELRCNPAKGYVDLFVNGRRVVRQPMAIAREKPDAKDPPIIHFGGWKPVIDARFALVEWGILRDSPTTDASQESKK